MTNTENWNDKSFVLEKVKRNGLALKYASEKLKNDKEVVLEAVRQYGGALEYASYELRNDKEFVLEAVKQDGKALEYASVEVIKKIQELTTMKKLLVITTSDDGAGKYLFENLSEELFELYLTADNQYICKDTEGCRKLNMSLENAIEITNTDERLKNLDGCIVVHFYY